ncbi:hypothetical protein EOB59_19135 [Mesorhizobium sp. M7A.F.Ca.MR.176.00.0.0]|uniref:hypothetical protein n=1 Tax=Mesorhizobium sp. M7A.F.Ca.MR.176.00.0.0 TaxID=2496776 RepID=UPI000FD4ADDE|nr:hypothetical protein [Mesorhizobium sp. M7A.F.Ca.MR.176.00.0.0]RUU89388.1 hypothetical protein EOB59_19135 [Mesorhizobium sp. M7A.F.Ca.MR.176.00.0.0]
MANLNTAVVGLDAVEKGHAKPETLNISWSPRDRVAAARKSRRFVLEAVLVRVAEALFEFVLSMAQLPRFKPVRSAWNSNTSRAEKLGDVAAEALGSENYLVAGATLLIHWRNRVVHPRSRASLTRQQIERLRAASGEIEQSFAGLSVDRLLNDFEIGQPTLKDISSLIAMSIRTAREVDKAANFLSNEDLDFLLEHYGLKARIVEIETQTTPTKRQASVLRMLQSAAPGLVEAYSRLHADTTRD